MDCINYFSDEDAKRPRGIALFEIKALHVPQEESKDKRYQWFLSGYGKISKLTFESMTIDPVTNDETRVFSEGVMKVMYNGTQCSYTDQYETTIYLTRQAIN